MKIETPSFAERELERYKKYTQEAQFHKIHIMKRLLQLKKEIKKLENILESLDIMDDDVIIDNIDDYHNLWKKRYGLDE